MNTTITATGLQGQSVTKELPAQGEIVVITTGSTKNRTYRQTVARVTGFATRSITGTDYAYYVTTAVSATGETLTDSRVRPATAQEITEFEAATATEVPFEMVSAEQAASSAHITACVKCRNSGETGHNCPEGMKLWAAAHHVHHDVDAAPITTVNRWGRTKGHWSALSAIAEVGINGGEITKAPAGMIEAGRAHNAARIAALRARPLTGKAPRRPSQR